MIEERLARLERHGHAHPIDLRQDVVHHVGVDVHVQRAVERIGGLAPAVDVTKRREGVGSRHR